MEPLESTTNPFGGVIPVPDLLPQDPLVLRSQLANSLEAWRAGGYKVVWLEVPLSRAALVPVAVDAGFCFHHAVESYVMLTLQLVEGAYVPPYASHYIGAGGVLLNDSRDLLVVSEKYRRRGRGPAYKLPGGALHPGEHLVDGIVREVYESDIYFVCRLSPLSMDITMREEELDECLWMPVEEFLAAEDISSFNKGIVRAALDSQGIVPATMEGYADPQAYEFFMPEGLP